MPAERAKKANFFAHRRRSNEKKQKPADLYAALDLGTNSCRMLIARPSGTEFEVIDAFSKPVHLGKGLEEHGTLSRAAINRTIQALHICQKKLKAHGVINARFVATEACRRAKNGKTFVKQVKARTGLQLEIIRPAEEARLAVVSCAPHVAPETEQLLVIDIGGGSTELAWIDLSLVVPDQRSDALRNLKVACPKTNRSHPGGVQIKDWISVPLGVATLNDQFNDVDCDSARFALMSCAFEDAVAEFGGNVDFACAIARGKFQIVGTSGTVTTVAASFKGLKRYERDLIDGVSMSAAEIETVTQEYLRLGLAGRRKAACIGNDRCELIMSGAAILQGVLRVWPTDKLTVADRGLREGLLYSQMAEKNAQMAETNRN
jgi:exopolyphosphatase/guanosine-5'-triphosphate,3'-diphosphate pyrophosphatase